MGWAAAQPMNVWALWGVAYGPSGPVYFGLEANDRLRRGPFEAYLNGRLLLGALPQASGRAGLKLEPYPGVVLRVGYDAWFADLPAEPRRVGLRADFEVFPGVAVSSAYALSSGRFGVGLGYRGGGLEARAWALGDGWLLDVRFGGSRLGLRSWYAASWSSLTARSAGAQLRLRLEPWKGSVGFSSAWGWEARLEREGLPGFWFAGRYRPGRVALARAGARGPLATGVLLDASLERSWRPFAAWAARLELRIDPYEAPVSQGE